MNVTTQAMLISAQHVAFTWPSYVSLPIGPQSDSKQHCYFVGEGSKHRLLCLFYKVYHFGIM